MKIIKRYRPVYMPATDNDDLTKDQPIFKTEDKAWDYIHKTFCQCELSRKNGLDYCELCEAEWIVEEVETTNSHIYIQLAWLVMFITVFCLLMMFLVSIMSAQANTAKEEVGASASVGWNDCNSCLAECHRDQGTGKEI